MSEKNLEPTSQRIRQAREDGQVAKSQDFGILVQSSVIFLWLMVEGPSLLSALGDNITLAIRVTGQSPMRALAQYSGDLIGLWLRFMFGLAGSLIVALTLCGLLQTGFLFAPKALKINAQAINPLANIKNIFSIKSLIELLKSLLKIAVLGLTFAYLIKRYGPSFAHLSQAGLSAGLVVASRMLTWMWSILLGATLIFAIADYGFQRFQWRKQLRMSRQEMEQEFKNSEGNPEVKQRRRELRNEEQSGSLDGKVAQASVVVRNPTRIAVCLRFQAGETPLPQVLAYGRDHRARQIIQLAERHGIPIVEQVPLARALLRATKPGDYIPAPLFKAVAEVLNQVQRQLEQQNLPD